MNKKKDLFYLFKFFLLFTLFISCELSNNGDSDNNAAIKTTHITCKKFNTLKPEIAVMDGLGLRIIVNIDNEVKTESIDSYAFIISPARDSKKE